MKFKIGQSVKVRKGILCSDDPEFDLRDWNGRIIDVSEWEMIVGIAWDSITLKKIPERYIEKSERAGLNRAVMYLSPSDID